MIKSQKKNYSIPVVEVIDLDAEISLILLSYPDDPGDMGKLELKDSVTPQFWSDKPAGV